MDLSNSGPYRKAQVSVVIPVLNEAGNVEHLVDDFNSLPYAFLKAHIKELLFVDDGSTDGTVRIIRNLMTKNHVFGINLIERGRKMGTVNAQLDGIRNALCHSVLIMDGDLQHPVKFIPMLVRRYLEGYDMVIASRYVEGASTNRKPVHGIISRGANNLAKLFLPWSRDICDPISGFFIVNRRIIGSYPPMRGFNKLALCILSNNKRISVSEVPFDFIERRTGNSKVSTGGLRFMVGYLSELRFYRSMHMKGRSYLPSFTASDIKYPR